MFIIFSLIFFAFASHFIWCELVLSVTIDIVLKNVDVDGNANVTSEQTLKKYAHAIVEIVLNEIDSNYLKAHSFHSNSNYVMITIATVTM